MCTVSLVRAGGLARLMCNRDERYDRPAAWSPVVARAGRHLALHPVDPQGGGTWVAATGAGLAFALLNGDGDPVAQAPSRGRLVLELLTCTSLEEAVAEARALSRYDWPPFRLVATDGATLFELRARAGLAVVREQVLERAVMFTSSSLGEAVVAPLRQALFERFLAGTDDPFDAQDAFHRHRWPDRPHLSVHMRRHDAATQSLTTVDLRPRTISMRYEPTTEVVGEPAMLSIDRVRAGVRPEAPAAVAAPAGAVASLAAAS